MGTSVRTQIDMVEMEDKLSAQNDMIKVGDRQPGWKKHG